MTRHQSWFRLATLCAVASLLLHALVFAWHVPGLSVGGQLARELGYRTVTICFGQGFKTIVVDASGQRVPDPDGPKRQQSSKPCPICAALAGSVLAFPVDVSVKLLSPPSRAVRYSRLLGRVHDRRPKVRKGHDPPVGA
jgi:Protein of unknown function (DUF2946)